MSYTPEETEYVVKIYKENPTRETVEALATKLERSTKSIIGKLSREGVYRKSEYLTKTGEKPVTKLELITEVEDILQLETGELEGMEKTPKPILKRLLEALREEEIGEEFERNS